MSKLKEGNGLESLSHEEDLEPNQELLPVPRVGKPDIMCYSI